MSDLYFVIAKNLAEFRECREEKLKDPEFASKYERRTIVMVTDPVHVKGYQIEHGCFWDNWRENPKIFYIMQNLVLASKYPEADKRIRQIYMDWRKETEQAPITP